MKRRRFILDWLVSDFAFLILAVMLAVLAWAFVNGGRQTEQRRVVKIQYLQPPRGIAFHRTPLREFKIDLSGSLFRLRLIKDEELIYPVDLSAASPGAFRIDIDIDNLRLPIDVEAAHPAPRSFTIYLEDMATMSVPLRPLILGAPKEGYAVGEIRLSPSAVNISGPRSLVSKMSQIDLEIPVGGRDANFSSTLKPKISLPDIEIQDSVIGEVEIRPIRVTREFVDVPVIAEGHSLSARVIPSLARVYLEGVSSTALDLEGKLKVVVLTEDLKKGRYRLRGQIQLPAGVKLIRVEPASFLVEIGSR